MERARERAKILVEALPYIQHFAGRTVVIKYGGHAMVDEALRQSFATDVVLLRYVGLRPVVVHGGGPQIGELLSRLGIDSRFVQGLRVTDTETMGIVEMVLGGKVNKEIVSLINQAGGRAVGLSGKDGRMIQARKITLEEVREEGPPEIIDPGHVGEVAQVDSDVIVALEDAGYIPVIAPVGVDEDGASLNINADAVAGKVAAALGADRLLLLTDVEGVKDGDGKTIERMEPEEARRLIDDGIAVGGMIPKLRCVLDALEQGVRSATILDGRIEHAVLLELLTDRGIGTAIRPPGETST